MSKQPNKYAVETKASISLINFQIVKTQFDVEKKLWGKKEASDECGLSLSFTTFTKDEAISSGFSLKFEVSLENENKTFLLHVEALADFIASGIEVNDQFIKTPLATGNAAAIAFPYLRSFISNFCQNSGFNPVILPGFNFTKVTATKD